MNYEYEFYVEVRVTVNIPANWDIQSDQTIEERYQNEWEKFFGNWFINDCRRFPTRNENDVTFYWNIVGIDGDDPGVKITDIEIDGEKYKQFYIYHGISLEDINGYYDCDNALEMLNQDIKEIESDFLGQIIGIGLINESDSKIQEAITHFRDDIWNSRYNPNFNIDVAAHYYVHDLDNEDDGWWTTDERPSNEDEDDFEADETENEEDIPSGSEESDSDDATESVGDNGCISNKKTNLFDIINDKLRNRWGLEGSADATTETSNYCRECGTKLEPGDAFCGNCGAKIK